MQNTINKIIELLKDKNISSTNISSSNILYMLGIHYNEVVICRLIKAIIEPNGFHGLGNRPFELFMRNVLGVEEDFEIGKGHAEIVLEEQIDNNRRIDIAIYYSNNDKVFVYPIEVKIWAKDQDRQLYDYYNYYKHKPDKTKIKKIYYLTPDGHDPSQESRGNLKDEIETISFVEEIKEYLCNVLQLTKNDECKNIINNLIEVIEVMGSDNKNIEVFKDVFRETEEKGEVLSLLKYADNLWEFAREEYLKQSLKELNKDIVFSVIPKEFNEVDSHGIFGFNYGNKEFYLCVDKNLYIATIKAKDGWEKYDDTDYCWRYICAKDSKKDKWNLKDIDVKLFEKTIDWGEYLP